MPDLPNVRRAVARLRKAEEKVVEAREDLAATLRAEHAAGAPPKDLIEVSGLARQTVFNALKPPAADGQAHQVQTVAVSPS
jgi:hypothetical protein